ncbi:MAG: phosphoribosylaminoimidazolesuccinocarboxamide synthase [Calditrichaeota bacterium]|nr:MAG: phosphoribosylaminoimidazolesuccinocarboxamide synthase [Calditrichota bacterium]
MHYPAVVTQTHIPGARLLSRGKVRDIYDAGDRLVIVATDRISAFDVVMNEGIPGKGVVLTQISAFWFRQMADIVPNHFISTEVDTFPAPFPEHRAVLQGRSMLVEKADPLPVECIVRGYLAGSGWKEYRRSGTVHGIALPAGLENASRLPEPLFTPSTKAETGHDENITFEDMARLVGRNLAETIRKISLAIYQQAATLAEEKGIIIADTKLEFGLQGERLLLIDELLTPDSSRFWPKATYRPGRNQPSLDKQYLRDYLETLDWDKTPPPPPLPEEVIENTAAKYAEILHILTGKTLDEFVD